MPSVGERSLGKKALQKQYSIIFKDAVQNSEDFE
jgi:hypothetical protein